MRAPYRLTDREIANLREEMQRDSAWMDERLIRRGKVLVLDPFAAFEDHPVIDAEGRPTLVEPGTGVVIVDPKHPMSHIPTPIHGRRPRRPR